MKHVHHTMNTIVSIGYVTAVPMCWQVWEYHTPVWRKVFCHCNIRILRTGETMEHHYSSTSTTRTTRPLQVTDRVISYLDTLCYEPSN